MTDRTTRKPEHVLTAFASLTYVTLFYVAIEWLFVTTQVSFLSPLPWWQKFWLGAEAFLDCLAVVTIAAIAIGVLGLILRALGYRGGMVAAQVALRGLAALVLGSALFMMIHNFAYTMTRVGVYASTGLMRGLFGVGFLALCWWAFGILRRLESRVADNRFTRHWASALLLCGLAVCHASVILWGRSPLPRVLAPNAVPASRPNILVIGSDAVPASLLSVYGFRKPTTPFLDSAAGDLLIFDNVLSNVNESSGSLVTMLSGKLPGTTRVASYPDIVSPANAYEHLPRMLGELGYETIELSIRNWADSFDLNFRAAFDDANGRQFTRFPYTWLARVPSFYSSYEFYLLYQFGRRLQWTVLYALDVSSETPGFASVSEEGFSYAEAQRKIDVVLSEVESSPHPVFAHVHLLESHGPRFQTMHQTFAGDVTNDPEEPPGLDDAILDFDSLIARVVGRLRETGKLDQTLIVIYSDHGHLYNPLERVPLVFRFPHASPAGRVESAAQLADVTPTILDYMHVPIPSWVEGKSLLAPEGRQPSRTLFTSSVVPWVVDRPVDPDFFTLAGVHAFQCQQYVSLDVQKRCVRSGTIPGFASPCPSSVETRTMTTALLDYLSRHAFQTTSVRAALTDPDAHSCPAP